VALSGNGLAADAEITREVGGGDGDGDKAH
jgi:hypothetical protein